MNFTDKLRSLFVGLDWFNCPVCQNGDGKGENELCSDCLKKFPFYRGKRCPGCGRNFDGVLAQCNECLNSPIRPWRKALALGRFSGINREMILELKYAGATHYARTLGHLAADLQKREGDKVDCVVPVPLHFSREISRGFNQATLIGEVVAKSLNVPLVTGLKRTRYVPHQAALDKAKRLKNLQNAFEIASSIDPVQNILLLDDVLTTGSTLSAAAQVLKAAGCHKISVLVIGR